MIGLAGQGQKLLKQRDGECAFCRWVMPDFVFALLAHLRVTLLLPAASLPHLKAYVPAKNLPRPGSSQDLGQGSYQYQQRFNVPIDTHSLH